MNRENHQSQSQISQSQISQSQSQSQSSQSQSQSTPVIPKKINKKNRDVFDLFSDSKNCVFREILRPE
jgi:hypothetical protein